MSEFGEIVAALIGLASIVMAVRIGWVIGEPVAMWLTGKVRSGKMEWRKGTAEGRPPVRYIVDGWGRIVYLELDPQATPPEDTQ